MCTCKCCSLLHVQVIGAAEQGEYTQPPDLSLLSRSRGCKGLQNGRGHGAAPALRSVEDHGIAKAPCVGLLQLEVISRHEPVASKAWAPTWTWPVGEAGQGCGSREDWIMTAPTGDLVRLEIEAALARNVRVIPIPG
jgi:hypothetical protein